MDNSDISEFYDKFSERQFKTGANERLISLYKRMLKAGLTKNSNVLELGCGVGIFTKMLSKTIKNGKIESIDLSPKSIEIARKFLTKKNIIFKTADVVSYKPEHANFNFITLLDVIEHIPLEKHPELFSGLSTIANENTQILINIPNPRYLEYMQKTNPETLQVIDQPIEFFELAKNLETNGLEIIFYEKYSIWQAEDYDFFIIRKKRNFKPQPLSETRSLREKIVNRIRRENDRIRYS